MKTITIFGASGRQGLAQVEVSLKAGHNVRAISRNVDAYPLQHERLQILSANYQDSESLKKVCEGADAVFLTPPSFTGLVSNAGRMQVLAAIANEAGVKRLVVNTSMFVPDKPIGQAVYDTRLELENSLEATGVPLTVFRPVLFMDNLLTDWVLPSLVKNDEFIYPHNPKMQATWICLEDVAKFMVKSLEDDSLAGERIVIGGPETFMPGQVAEVLSRALGRKIVHAPSTPEEFANSMHTIFFDVIDAPKEVYATMVSDLYRFNNESEIKPMVVDMAPVLKRIPVELTTMEEWAARQNWTLRDPDAAAPIGG